MLEEEQGRQLRKSVQANIVMKKQTDFCFKVSLREVDDIPEPSMSSTRDCYVRFECGDAIVESAKVVNSTNPRWTPPEKLLMPIVNMKKDKLLLTLMDWDKWWDDVALGVLILKAEDFPTGSVHQVHRPFISSDTGHPMTTTAHLTVEVCTSEEASKMVEHRIYEQERYVPFVGWSAGNLRKHEPHFISDDFQHRGDNFADAETPLPAQFVVKDKWSVITVPDGDPDGWTYAQEFDAECWFNESSLVSGARRRMYLRSCIHLSLK